MKIKYPLQQIITIKKRRLREAERVLKEKKEELEKEKKLKDQIKQKRDETFNHKLNKVDQLRDELDKGTTSDKIQIMKSYIKAVDEELQKKDRDLWKKDLDVKKAEERVEAARKDMLKKQNDVEKLKTHKKEWSEKMKVEMEYKEGVELDELGTVMHSSKKRK